MITVRADIGGGPEHLYNLTKNLSKNFNIFIASPKEDPYWKKYQYTISSDNQIEIPKRKFKLFPFLHLIKFTVKNKIDLIHSHGKGAGIYGRLLAFFTFTKSVHTFHGIHTDKYAPLQKKLYILIEKILSVITSKIISLSESEYKKLILLKIANNRKIELIYNGVDIPDKVIYDENFFRVPKKILTVTRFDFAKNSELIIDILKEIDKLKNFEDYEMIVVGDGESRKKVQDRYAEKGIKTKIRFIGFTNEVTKFYSEAFCYLSTSRWEGMPLAVLEAMSYGLPVVATEVIGNIDLVKTGISGYLYDLNSPEQAAKDITELGNEYSKWKNFSITSRKMVEENFTVELMSKKVSDLYRNILRKK